MAKKVNVANKRHARKWQSCLTTKTTKAREKELGKDITRSMEPEQSWSWSWNSRRHLATHCRSPWWILRCFAHSLLPFSFNQRWQVGFWSFVLLFLLAGWLAAATVFHRLCLVCGCQQTTNDTSCCCYLLPPWLLLLPPHDPCYLLPAATFTRCCCPSIIKNSHKFSLALTHTF